MTCLIFGAGFSGRAIAQAILARDPSQIVFGTTRSNERFAELEALGVQPLLFPSGKTEHMSRALEAAMGEVTWLVHSIAPDAEGDPLSNVFGADLKQRMPNLKAMSYLSTVGVYGDHNGAWVNEDTAPKPVSKRSVWRLKAEQFWQEIAQKSHVPLYILRLSGIYGPGRNGFRTALSGKARRLVKKDQVFNRIRVEDIGRAALFLADQNQNGIFNVTDDEPAPPQDVVTYACKLAGLELPDEMDFETADLTPMARSFYGENKRVSNAKIKQLGFVFDYPNYQMSMTDLWTRKAY